ncbi:MAG: DNA repair protein RadC [Rickettsiales bacterium]|jgi:DNA repair protein RadC|nr:DNA repair protein RadC [Rickettsiales bacterium]
MTNKDLLFETTDSTYANSDVDDSVFLGHRFRLREKFLNAGANALADYELLELLLTFAIPRVDVKPIAKQLMNKFGSLAAVVHAESNDLAVVSGVKETTVALIKTVQEFLLRTLRDDLKSVPILNNYTKVLDYCRALVAFKNVEQFRILYLDNKFNLIGDDVVQEGTINYAAVYPREVVKRVLAVGAVNVIIFHNHPTGDPNCSQNDIDITKKIRIALNSVDVVMIDHLIIGDAGRYFSFKNQGLI